MEGTAVFGRLTWHTAKVLDLREETSNARTIAFAVRGWPGHVAGQHVDVRLTAPDGYSAVRSYSIVSAPNLEGRVEITVERIPAGEVSPYLTLELMVGDEVELRGPIGGWFVWRSDQTEPIQLLAGGSGIVPLMGMIRSHAVSKEYCSISIVVFSARTRIHTLPPGTRGSVFPARACQRELCIHSIRSEGLVRAPTTRE